MPYRGKGKKRILIIGEAPGRNEDERGEQFVGKAGKRLQKELHRLQIDLNRDCWKTNAVRCYPSDGKTPDSKTVRHCRTAVFREIRELQPEKILLFGNVAAESVLGHLWTAGGKYPLSTWSGWNIPHRELNAWISVHYHPSYLNRSNDPLLDLIFRRELKRSLSFSGRPCETVRGKYEDQVEILYKASSVAKALRDFKNVIVPDYETNCLKPEYPGAEIVSCAICGETASGIKVYAFPWFGATAEVVGALLRSRIKKIASNAKFEERWTQHVYGHGVRNWYWDTMLAAHVLNNAQGTTGLKFQAFVLLGQAPYNLHIEPYIKPTSGGKLNRIRELSWNDILLYNGMDSLLEYKVAKVQQKMMGFRSWK